MSFMVCYRINVVLKCFIKIKYLIYILGSLRYCNSDSILLILSYLCKADSCAVNRRGIVDTRSCLYWLQCMSEWGALVGYVTTCCPIHYVSYVIVKNVSVYGYCVLIKHFLVAENVWRSRGRQWRVWRQQVSAGQWTIWHAGTYRSRLRNLVVLHSFRVRSQTLGGVLLLLHLTAVWI